MVGDLIVFLNLIVLHRTVYLREPPGLQELVKLLEKAAGARSKGPPQDGAEPPVCHSLNILVGIAEVRNIRFLISFLS